jgi:UDP-3-O-[3-hydroxymyristoyl] glucosamine N-acyltransferase
VIVYFDCVLGNNIIIHSGAIIGSDGFGFAPNSDGTYNKISQIGNVVIEDNVEIGSNTTIDRATMGSTIIRKGVKLDNLVQIAHNVEIGSNTVIAAQSGISGSTKIGENVIMGGQAGIAGHLTIAKGTKWGGSPATIFQSHMRSQVVLNRLPELEKRINELEKIIAELKKEVQ